MPNAKSYRTLPDDLKQQIPHGLECRVDGPFEKNEKEEGLGFEFFLKTDSGEQLVGYADVIFNREKKWLEIENFFPKKYLPEGKGIATTAKSLMREKLEEIYGIETKNFNVTYSTTGVSNELGSYLGRVGTKIGRNIAEKGFSDCTDEDLTEPFDDYFLKFMIFAGEKECSKRE